MRRVGNKEEGGWRAGNRRYQAPLLVLDCSLLLEAVVGKMRDAKRLLVVVVEVVGGGGGGVCLREKPLTVVKRVHSRQKEHREGSGGMNVACADLFQVEWAVV